MKRFVGIILITLITILSAQGQTRSAAQIETIMGQLEGNLKNAKTAKDSVKILYDLFDIAPRAKKPAAINQLFVTAARAGMQKEALDAARQMTTFYNSEEGLKYIRDVIAPLPNTREKKETFMFLKMRGLANTTKKNSEAQRQSELTNLISDIEQSHNPDDKLLDLYTVVEYLRNDTKGDILDKCLDELVELVNSDDYQCYALKNIVYSEAANIYSDVNDYKKAVDADLRLLGVIDALDREYAMAGREYRDYNVSRYVCYRRMLRNYPALTPVKIAEINRECQRLAEIDPAIKRDMEQKPRYKAFYLTATGKYAEAIPYIKAQLEEEKSLTGRRQLLVMLRDAAKRTGDTATYQASLEEYSTLLEKLNEMEAAAKYKELQIAYNVNKLHQKNDELKLKNAEDEKRATLRLMNFVVAAWVLLVLVGIGLMIYWRRNIHDRKNLDKFVDDFLQESDRMRVLNYRDYVEVSDEEMDQNRGKRSKKVNKKEKSKRGTVIEKTESMLNSLCYIASLGHATMLSEVAPVKCKRFIDDCVTEVSPYLKPGVNIVVKECAPDIVVRIDREVTTYVIMHLLRNAVRYTKTGEITVEPVADPDNGKLRITITDTGLPLMPGEEKLLFEDFVNVDDIVMNQRGGLFIVRMLSFLLKSNLKSMPAYRNGVRVALTLPMEHK